MSRPRTVSMVDPSQSADTVDDTALSGIVVTQLPDGTKVSTVVAHASTEQGETAQEIKYSDAKVVGNGSFGVVFQAHLLDEHGTDSCRVAIKKVLQDKRFKNRELQTMKTLKMHPNVVRMHYYFLSDGTKPDEVYLNLVLEYIPKTLYQVVREHSKRKSYMPLVDVKLYTYQMFRGLSYLHALGLCHRDVKPQNLLVDQATKVLKLCDFGSAKRLVPGQPNVAYICSRYYRAPELIFGATDYTNAIDVWSAGCVVAELLLGQPLFPGESGVDQLVEIIKVLGTPTMDQVRAMNPNYTESRFPQIKAHPWSKVFPQRTPGDRDVVELVSHLLEYIPTNRVTFLGALGHQAFDELREPGFSLEDMEVPPLFDFTDFELGDDAAGMRERLEPAHRR